ncbi:hypothetical protein PC41400_16895 [Paenibacillus chitinolyticus]|uniref:Uncharacterized protein n=1 Tax=Paenibacillus chitinolyticus TaxID=79263 RepID=A0A410WY49_9BACL|nr:hypothetical protein [Paenibacillus chitinolyticus]MCY9589891.1 hypothetical protein [Paenibacillus chitinolyticus]MCY9598108.1 hypothetical protein [Paenibacillus chitinolyticus]QAV19263.1 hypothetical protein PC41400_16895 [Paenibacillus chitinolyticus]
MTDYNGDLELKYPFTVKPWSGSSFPTPQPVELAVNQVGEANEGQLVKAKNVWITGEYGSGDGGGVTVTHGDARRLCAGPFGKRRMKHYFTVQENVAVQAGRQYVCGGQRGQSVRRGYRRREYRQDDAIGRRRTFGNC